VQRDMLMAQQMLRQSSVAQAQEDKDEDEDENERKLAAFKIVVPPNIIKHRQNDDLRVFTYSKGVQKSAEKKPVNEFKHLWVSKSYIFTKDGFPALRRRLEVVDRKEIFLKPIQNAFTAVNNKTDELRDLIDKVEKASPPVDVGPLSMILNGMIDAAVQGGTQKYMEAFLSSDFLKENPDQESADFVKALKTGLGDQIELLKTGLNLYGQKCDPKLQDHFKHLQSFYAQLKEKTKDVIVS